MKINITESVHPSGGAQEVVLFASPVGISRGRWMGPEPARLAVYDVELDFPDEVGGFDVLLAGGEGMIEWSVEDESIIAVGIVVTVGEMEDPIVEISLGEDIVLVEAPSAKSEVAIGNSVRFKAVRLDIYPYEL